MKKKFLIPVLIVAAYYFMGTESGKNLPNSPCFDKIDKYLHTDTVNGHINSYFSGLVHDTLLIRTFKDTLWDVKAAAICHIMSDSCKLLHQKILVIDSTSDPALFNSLYGKSIYFTQCP